MDSQSAPQQQTEAATTAQSVEDQQQSLNLAEASAPASPSKQRAVEESNNNNAEDDTKSTSGASDDGSVSQGSVDVSSAKSTHPDENQAESNLEKVLDDALDVLKEAKVELLATVTETITQAPSKPAVVITPESKAIAQQRYMEGLIKKYASVHSAPRHFEKELTSADREYLAEVSVKHESSVGSLVSKLVSAAASKFLGIGADNGLTSHLIGMVTGEGNVKRITSIAKSLQLTQDDVVNEYNTLKAFQESAMTFSPSSLGKLSAPSMARFNEANSLVKL